MIHHGDGFAPVRDGASARRALRVAGAVLLVVLLFLYRSRDATGLIQIRPHWWALLLGAVALLYCVYLAEEAGLARWLVALAPYLSVGRAVASHSAIAVSGTLLGVLLLRHRREGAPAWRIMHSALGYAAGLAAAGALLHTLHGLHRAFWVSKVLATPPWCLLSSAITAATWVAVLALTDLKGWRRWPKALSIAGENALL